MWGGEAALGDLFCVLPLAGVGLAHVVWFTSKSLLSCGSDDDGDNGDVDDDEDDDVDGIGGGDGAWGEGGFRGRGSISGGGGGNDKKVDNNGTMMRTITTIQTIYVLTLSYVPI